MLKYNDGMELRIFICLTNVLIWCKQLEKAPNRKQLYAKSQRTTGAIVNFNAPTDACSKY